MDLWPDFVQVLIPLSFIYPIGLIGQCIFSGHSYFYNQATIPIGWLLMPPFMAIVAFINLFKKIGS